MAPPRVRCWPRWHGATIVCELLRAPGGVGLGVVGVWVALKNGLMTVRLVTCRVRFDGRCWAVVGA